MMSGKDVFISYGREPDVVLFVKQLKKDLEINGINVWVDTDDIPLGTDWRAEITTGVDSCRCVNVDGQVGVVCTCS